ncbi:MAG: hypothetical protein Q9188_002833 [Gyalolechia gomerana]
MVSTAFKFSDLGEKDDSKIFQANLNFQAIEQREWTKPSAPDSLQDLYNTSHPAINHTIEILQRDLQKASGLQPRSPTLVLLDAKGGKTQRWHMGHPYELQVNEAWRPACRCQCRTIPAAEVVVSSPPAPLSPSADRHLEARFGRFVLRLLLLLRLAVGKKLDNVRAGGPMHILRTKRPESNDSYFVFLFEKANFHIPYDIAMRWGPDDDPFVNVKYDIASGLHARAYASNAPMNSDGGKLGIKMTKLVDGKLENHWVQARERGSAVIVANSIYDWLTGAVGEDADTRDWGADRVPLYGKQSFHARARERLGIKTVPQPKPSNKHTALPERRPMVDLYLQPTTKTAQGEDERGAKKKVEEELAEAREDEEEEEEEDEEEEEEEEGQETGEAGDIDIWSEEQLKAAQEYQRYLHQKYGAAHAKHSRYNMAMGHGSPLDEELWAYHQELESRKRRRLA